MEVDNESSAFAESAKKGRKAKRRRMTSALSFSSQAVIDICKISSIKSSRFFGKLLNGTDYIYAQLHLFLHRFDVKDVTRELSLKKISVTGVGLLPLIGSQVLETIDLRIQEGYNSETTSGFMLPHQLKTVKPNRPTDPHSLSYALGSILIHLALDKADQVVAGC